MNACRSNDRDFSRDDTADILYQNPSVRGPLGVLTMSNGTGTWVGIAGIPMASTGWSQVATSSTGGGQLRKVDAASDKCGCATPEDSDIDRDLGDALN